MNLWKFLFVSTLLLSPTVFAANDIVGQYYSPFKPIVGTPDFEPEMLRKINPGGSYEIHTIHDGQREVYEGSYSVVGNNVTFLEGKYTAKCDWVQNSDDGTFTVSFKKSSSELTLFSGSDSQTLQVATAQQAVQVLAVPLCK